MVKDKSIIFQIFYSADTCDTSFNMPMYQTRTIASILEPVAQQVDNIDVLVNCCIDLLVDRWLIDCFGALFTDLQIFISQFYLSIYLSIYLSACLPIYLSIYIYLSN